MSDFIGNCYGRLCICEKPPRNPEMGRAVARATTELDDQIAADQARAQQQFRLAAAGLQGSAAMAADLAGAPQRVVDDLLWIQSNMMSAGVPRVGSRAPLGSRGAGPRGAAPRGASGGSRRGSGASGGAATSSGEAGGAFVNQRRAPRFDSAYGTRKELKQFLDDMKPGEGATLVYDKDTGRWVLARSADPLDPAYQAGWVDHRGGHSALAREHFGLKDYELDVMRGLPADHPGRPLVGGSISKLPNGSLDVKWVSGGIQGDLPGRIASAASQSAALHGLGQFANPLTPSGLVNLIQGAAATPSGLLNTLSPPSSFYPNVK